MAGSLVPRTNLGGYLAEIGQVYADQRDREEAAKLLGNQLDGLVQQPSAQTMPAPQSGLAGIGQQLGLYTPGQATPKVGGSSLPAFAQNGEIGRYASAIQSNESGGNYGIVGPTHPKYGRALGAYQVMESNLPSWSREALGREVSPDEFLKNPQIQDAIFQKKFGQAVAKYGNPQDAASVWFTGRPLAQGANARDSLGTTGQRYVDKFTAALGRGAPSQASQADMPAPGAQEAAYFIPGQEPPAGQQSGFTPGSVASPPIGSGAAGSMPEPANGQPRITPQQAQQLRAMLANPITAPQAQAMIQKLQAPQEWETKELGGRVVQVNKQGAVRPLPGFEKAPEFQTVTGPDGNAYVFNKATGQLNNAIAGKDQSVRDLTPGEKQARGIEPNVFAQVDANGNVSFPGKPSNVVNLDQKSEGAFAGEAGSGLAKRFQDISKEGDAGRTELGLVGQLKELADQIGTGGGAAATAKLAEYGIKVGPNVGKIEAYQSLVDKLTPSQRLPGAGATSDFDAKLFKSSLPRLVNTPEGNALISSTLEALAQDKVARAEIADKALIGEKNGGITTAEAVKQLRALPAPNLVFKSGLRDLQQAGRLGPQAPQSAQRQGASAAQATPGMPQVGAVQKGHRFLGGDPANPASWERVGAPAQDGPIL